MRTAETRHRWKFFRAGGVDQVLFRDGDDLARLEELDQKLWVALAVPTRGTEFDPVTADLLDTDKDGRIRPPELIAAVNWMADAVQDLGAIMTTGDSVPLAWIKDPDLLAGARRILDNLGKPRAEAITLADVTDTEKVFAATRFNGDGVVPADSASDEPTRKVIEDIIATLGGVPDRSGKPGVNQANLDAFFEQANAHDQWEAKAESDAAIESLGIEATASAAAAIKAVEAKVDDYFARCRLAAFDPRALGALNREEKEYLAVAAQDLSSTAQEVAFFPLARVEAGRALPLHEGLNPAWAATMAEFASRAVEPLLGEPRTSVTEAEWRALRRKVAPYEAWSSAKPTTEVDKLGSRRIREILATTARPDIAALIQKDLELEKENAQITAVEKLVRLRRDLYELLTNFVNFADFYGRTGAVFQAGTLILDARSCSLCIEVADPGKHAALAGLAGAYLAYCDITRSGNQKKTIVALFTDGDSDNLMVGRNGIFYDRKGQDWDATITKIVTNPISVREAFWTPYKKFARLVEEQIARRAASADTEAHQRVAQAAEATAKADKLPDKGPGKKIDVGTVAALGVALGSIGTFFGLILGKFLDLGLWMPVGVVALVLLISGPSMLLAWLKLRNRNLGPILDANGWAINTKARMNVPFGAALTHVAKLPAGAERSLKDPFVEKRQLWPASVAAVAGLALVVYSLNHQGYLHRWTRGLIGSQVAKVAPAAVAPEAHAESIPEK